MGARRIAAIALSGTVILGGTGVAIAAVTNDDGKKAEQAVLDDAAKRLDVTPEKLRDALSAAQDAQLDQAVKDGDLTQKQADAIKAARKQSGRVFGGPHGKGGHHVFGGPGDPKMRRGHVLGARGGMFGDIAKALGTTQAKLFAQLRAGKSLADVIKASGKSTSAVSAAVKASTKTRLDKAVKSGDITQKQADAMLDHVDEAVKAIASGKNLRVWGPKGHHRGGRSHPGGPPVGKLRPGRFEAGPGLVMPGTYS